MFPLKCRKKISSLNKKYCLSFFLFIIWFFFLHESHSAPRTRSCRDLFSHSKQIKISYKDKVQSLLDHMGVKTFLRQYGERRGYLKLSEALGSNFKRDMWSIFQSVKDLLSEREFQKLRWLYPFNGTEKQFERLMEGFFESPYNLRKKNGTWIFQDGKTSFSIKGSKGFTDLAHYLFPHLLEEEKQSKLSSMVLSLLTNTQIIDLN